MIQVGMARVVYSNEAIRKILKANKIIYPLPGFHLVLYAYLCGLPTSKMWMFIDVSMGIPIFINLFAILILTPKFPSLLRDYRARYISIPERLILILKYTMSNN